MALLYPLGLPFQTTNPTAQVEIYWDDLDPAHFLLPEIERNYPQKDYHRIYFGEIVAIYGDESYAA